jgi:outer membrane protein insertion porin family
MRWLLVCLLTLPGSTWAQRPQKKAPLKAAAPAAAASKAWPLESVEVEGNRNFTAQQVLAVAGLKPGDVVGDPQFEAARQKLSDSGAFETVGYRYDPSPNGKSIRAKIVVSEIAQVYPVRFENLNAPQAELEKYLRSVDPLYSRQIPGTKQILDRYARALETYLGGKGQKEDIVGVLTSEGPDQLFAVFRPAGAPPVIAQVNFRGNQVIPSDALRRAISRVAIGAPYNEKRMREILDMSLRPLYDARGRIRVAFPKIEAVRAKDVSGMVVTVDVVEGDSYKLGDVAITGTRAPQDPLRKAAGFKPDDVANFEEINSGIERIHQVLRRNGLMRVTSQVERKIDETKKSVDVEIKVNEGPQYTFGKLEIKGLDIHGEAAVKKLWAMKEGKPFDAGYPAFFLDRIREDAVFDNLGKTKVDLKTDDASRTVDVTLTFSAPPLPEKKKF